MKRTSAYLLSLLLLLVPWWLQAQQDNGQNQAVCSISGTVVDAVSGQPVIGAQVMARSGMGSSTPSAQSSATDAEGHFAFTKLAPGRYILFASKEGYVPRGQDGRRAHQVFTLAPGQTADDVALSLSPGGIITGHVVDEKGKPIHGVSIHLMAPGSWGESALVDQNETTSNQAGEYRFTGLTGGKYFLQALYPGHVTAKPGANQAYAPVCYPSGSDLSACAPMMIRPGEELSGIDLTFNPVSAVHVTGKILDSRTSAPASGVDLTLLRDESGGLFQVDEISPDEKGNFVLPSVPAGTYLLVAQREGEAAGEHALWGSKSLEVRNKDISDVRVLVSTGVNVSGHLRVEGKTPVDLGAMVGSLEPENSSLMGYLPDVENARVAADGSFSFSDVPEGKYKVEFFPLPQGFYFKSAGGSDVLESGITVSRGQPYFGLELVISPGAGRVQGSVSASDQPAPGTLVLLVPDQSRHAHARDFRRAMTDSSGRFSIRSVAPGDYHLFAFESVDNSSLSDPEFLRQFEDRAASVHVKDNDDVTVHAEVISADSTQ